MDETAEIIRKLLKNFHNVTDYAIVVPKELLQQAQVLQMMFNLLLVLIAGIALVGGWYWHHEHHARHGHRAHTRNRHSAGSGGQTARHCVAVSQ